ncbi:MAG: hypothetical protein K6D02_02855 [Lachnospiraceae bacterium]|nr:hypothetical protein [Lachnospiraceae bacterium]
MSDNVYVKREEVFQSISNQVEGHLYELNQKCSESINECESLCAETESEQINSLALLEEAKRIEEEKRLILIAAEEELAAAQMSGDPEWIAAATARVIKATIEYGKAVAHRKKMEKRYSMAVQANSMANQRLSSVRNTYYHCEKEIRDIANTQLSRVRQADQKLDDYLRVSIPETNEEQVTEKEKEKQKKVPMNKGKDSEVIFVFSCPGQEEEKSGKLVTGETGKNMDILVSYLHRHKPQVFKYKYRYDYQITNASDLVHYKALTGDSEASDSELFAPGNISRLQRETEKSKYIICMGDKAKSAVSKLNINGKIIYGEHIGNVHLNLAYEAKSETASARRRERVGYVAEEILNQL